MVRTFVVVGICLAVAACSGPAEPEAREVVLGANIDKTGSIARPAWHDAVLLAASHANEGLKTAGGLKALKFVVEQGDTTNTPEVAVTRAQELVNERGAKMLVTDTSADDIAINLLQYDADPSNDLNVPIVCMACTSGAINNPNATNADPAQQAALRNEKGWNFRSSMVSKPQGVVIANIAKSQANNGDADGNGTFKVAVYNIDDAYGNGFHTDIVAGAAAVGITPVIEQVKHVRDADPNGYNWSADITKLTDSKNEQTGLNDGPPDLVVFVDFPSYAAAATKAYIQSGTNIRLLQTHNFRHDSVIEALAGLIEGQEGTSHVIADGESGKIFSDALEAHTSRPTGFWDAQSYDAAMTLMLAAVVAIQKNDLEDPAAVTGEQIRDAMKEINSKDAGAVKIVAGADGFSQAVKAITDGKAIDYEGASGPMDYDATGNVIGRIARFRYQNQRFEDVQKFDCLANPTCPAQ